MQLVAEGLTMSLYNGSYLSTAEEEAEKIWPN